MNLFCYAFRFSVFSLAWRKGKKFQVSRIGKSSRANLDFCSSGSDDDVDERIFAISSFSYNVYEKYCEKKMF